MNDRSTCGKRFVADVQYRYTIEKLHLNAVIPVDRATDIMPNSVTNDMYPLRSREFEFQV